MRRAIIGITLVGVLVCGTVQANAGLFLPLGDLPGGPFRSTGNDVSADGSVVIGTGNSAAGLEAFRWTAATGVVGLGDLPGGSFQSGPSRVSADGSVIVGTGSTAAGFKAFRWTAATGMVGLGDPPGFFSTGAGVSSDGSVIVGWTTAVTQEAFRWTAATGMVGLGDLPGGVVQSIANNVSADGSVVVGESTSSAGKEAFRWTAATGMVGLGDLPGGSFESTGLSVSADGSVVVGTGRNGRTDVGLEAFRWTAATGMVGLGDLPGGVFISQALGVSPDGSVVVGTGSTTAGSEAFLWDTVHGMRNLLEVLISQGNDLNGWRLTEARGVSADGLSIVGTGINPLGQTEAWLARLDPVVVPEPSSLVSGMLGVVMVSIGFWRQHRRSPT